MTARRVTIYEIAFSDGTCYVGQTSKHLPSRIYQHRYGNSNRRLAARLRSADLDHTVSILAVVDEDQANAAEQAEIAARRNLLNYYAGGSLGSRIPHPAPFTEIDARAKDPTYRPIIGSRERTYSVYPPTVESMRCSCCRVTKPAAQFHRDRCRWNGLHSRCADCANRLSRERRAARRAQKKPARPRSCAWER